MNLDPIAERILNYLEEKNQAREAALKRSRDLVRFCSTAIRAVHRAERPQALKRIEAARALVQALRQDLAQYPDLLHAGYTQAAFKEFVEANVVYALIGDEPLPEPEALEVEYSAYLGGLGEAVGELRRHTVDLLRAEKYDQAERRLEAMDEIYSFLVTVDFPDAITGSLRRITDMVRGVTERTRSDLATTIQQQKLIAALQAVDRKLPDA